MINQLKKVLNVEFYNEEQFNKPFHPSISPLSCKYDTLKFPNESLTSFPSLSELHKDTNICPP